MTATAPAAAPQEDLKARMDRLEKQNQDLLEALKKLQSNVPAPPPAANPVGLPVSTSSAQEGEAPVNKDQVQQIVSDYLKGIDDRKVATEKAKADEGYQVGKHLGLTASWTGNQPWLESADKAFRIHFGGRTQFDAVWATANTRVQEGIGNTGDFDDAVNFRRGRLEMDGWLWETFDFFCEYDFFNTVNDNPGIEPAKQSSNVINAPCPTDLWGAINYIPWIGTLRIGNMKPGFSLEHLISSRYLDFLERAAIFDTYIGRNNGFQPGVQILNWTDNERFTWQFGLFKSQNTIFGWNSGDGEYQVNGRATWLPYYEDNGRRMLHLGLGAQFNDPDNGQAVLRNRWLLRNGPPTTHNTVALAIVNGNNQFMVAPELFFQWGPLSIQAEYLACNLNEVTSFQTQPQGTVTPATPTHYFSQSAYIHAMYFLTGEHRPYGKTGLHSSGAAPTRIIPHRNFFWVPGQGCGNPFSQGAWQVGARYSYTDLSNNGIFGGQINEVTLGLNWFLNPNVKIQWNYDIGHRSQLGSGVDSNGTYQGFGTRLAFDW